MIDRFEELLKELGDQYSIALHPDKLGACKLHIDNTLHVQLECDAHQENLLLATFICDIPPGKFRENILKDGLQANSNRAHGSVLAYSDKNNQLTLFQYLRLADLNGQKLADSLATFVERANLWRTGVETGQTHNLK